MFFLEIPIPANTELGEAILAYFKKNNTTILKSNIIKSIREHRVYFENKPVGFLPFKVFKKGKIQFYMDEPGWKITKEDILFEDPWLIVINKPSGLASQSSLKLLQDHAYSAVICYLRNKKTFTSPQLFLLHRLDKDTSGVLLMSKKSSINKGIQDLFEKKKIQKHYWAVSKTKNSPKISQIVTSYIGRKPDNEHKFKFGSFPKDHSGGKFSETHFKKLDQKGNYSLFKISPQTGRSHQIRVHLSENGHPILGDVFYKGEKSPKLFLHAKTLSFDHPKTKEFISIKAPLPEHWVDLLDKTKLNT